MKKDELFSHLAPLHVIKQKQPNGNTSVFFPDLMSVLSLQRYIDPHSGGHFKYFQDKLFNEYEGVDKEE